VLDRYAARGVYVNYALKVVPPQTTVQLRAMSDADVYTLRAELYLTCRDCGEPVRPEVDRNLALALAEDPGHLRALALRASRAHGAQQLALSRDLVRAHPEAWLAWLLLASAELDSQVGLTACDPEVPDRLLALAPSQPYALGLAAVCEQRAGHEDNALAWSERALRLKPASTKLMLQRAGILQAFARCAELDALLPRMKSGWHEPVPAAQLEALSRCAAKGGGELAIHPQ
jgi:hypothetical protein